MPRKINIHDVHDIGANVLAWALIIACVIVLGWAMFELVMAIWAHPIIAAWIVGVPVVLAFLFHIDQIIVWVWNKFIADSEKR